MLTEYEKEILDRLEFPPSIQDFIAHVLEHPDYHDLFKLVDGQGGIADASKEFLSSIFFTLGFLEAKSDESKRYSTIS